MDIEKEMLTTDGLGGELASVKQAEANEPVVCTDNGLRIHEGDEVHQEGFPLSKGWATVTHIASPELDEEDKYGIHEIPPYVTLDYKDGSGEEEFKTFWSPLDSFYVLEEWEITQ